MKSNTLKEIRNLDKALSKTSWTHYRKILRSVVVSAPLPEEVQNRILGYLRNQDVVKLLEEADSLSAQKYADATSHFVANQISYLIKKYPFPPDLCREIDPEKKAREKFFDSEQKCKELNRTLLFRIGTDERLSEAVHFMRGFIRHVLGELPSDFYDKCDFGPGASVGVSGNATNVGQKIDSRWSTTPAALHRGFAAFMHDWNLISSLSGKDVTCLDPELLFEKFRNSCDVVDYNKLAFVPKTAKVHRTIAVEPLINSYLQKGIDEMMRLRLKRIGIDLSDQSRNSEMARLGSLSDDDESFVTIDLSSASDSISISLVEELMPPEWLDLLRATRCENYLIDNEKHRYEKFCSMGNGFCFPLETLIFTAVCASQGCGTPSVDFRVYGDDIIIRKKFAPQVIAVLCELGFDCNPEKTFVSGPFRESCGADWFEGKDVRPFILDYALDCVQGVFKFLNLTKRSELTTLFFAEISTFVKSLIPRHLLFLRPRKGPPDSGVDCEVDEFMSSPNASWNKTLWCWRWRELISRPVIDRTSFRRGRYSLMIAAVRGASANSPFTLRRKTRTTVRMVSYG